MLKANVVPDLEYVNFKPKLYAHICNPLEYVELFADGTTVAMQNWHRINEYCTAMFVCSIKRVSGL
jgi:hypothetical protein